MHRPPFLLPRKKKHCHRHWLSESINNDDDKKRSDVISKGVCIKTVYKRRKKNRRLLASLSLKEIPRDIEDTRKGGFCMREDDPLQASTRSCSLR